VKLVLISHCNFHGNSAMHVFSIANELVTLGAEVVVCVPDSPETVHSHGVPKFLTVDYLQARGGAIAFRSGENPDLIHAWTPRELVRKLTEELAGKYHCPYVVHLEDNEEVILKDDLRIAAYEHLYYYPEHLLDSLVSEHRSHPVRYRQFLSKAVGITALMDRLLEFKPEGVPCLVFWPGFDSEFAAINGADTHFRERLGLKDDKYTLVYTGNVHASNVREVQSLYLAAAILHRRGVPIRLLKTGWNFAELNIEPDLLSQYVKDLGFLARADVPSLLSLADVLVQPGKPDQFNDYRFPSKLPEYLVSGRPVVLPRTNIGRFIADGAEAILLDAGHAEEVASKVQILLDNQELRKRVGEGGRKFALEHLSWAKNVVALSNFYEEICSIGQESRRPASLVDSSPWSRDVEPASTLPAKLIAFYLPQFHPIPENDEWWGKGFTEWRNVVRAKPQFPGHYQPQLPADLGFYDLRVPEVMVEQAALARAYGIYGFCFYYYWFGGRRVLERPLDNMLALGQPDLPFCICWANENWTRRWDGSEKEILLKQEYSGDWDERLIRDVIPIFRTPNYIRLKGAPLFLVYRVHQIPDARKVAERWRQICRDEGIPEIHLCAMQTFGIDDPRDYGFDAAVEFPPHMVRALIDPSLYSVNPDFAGYVEDYVAVARAQLLMPLPSFIRYRGVMPAWDNTARVNSRAHIVVRSSPSEYETWLTRTVTQSLHRQDRQEAFIFINAWNEWAEGAHLEPDQKFGHAYLEATRKGLIKGIGEYCSAAGIPIDNGVIERWAGSADPAVHVPVSASTKPTPSRTASIMKSVAKHAAKTAEWFNDDQLDAIASRYSNFPLKRLSYATARDYCDSYDHLYPIATANGDLKDCQRPWILKAILSKIPRGGRLIEIGAGEPFIADLLRRVGYEIWVVDPYDGSGNGPQDYERFRAQCPDLHFIREVFSDRIGPHVPERGIDCIYSISVLEHIPAELMVQVFAGMRKFLKPTGTSIHAVDHVHRGDGAAQHLAGLRFMIENSGFDVRDLDQMLVQMERDTETYYLSAESHNRWRGSVAYDDFPMRVCVSIQMVSTASEILAARKESSDFFLQ
jgi:glycosyltransferase involved in cell wall biosynthesis